MTNTNLPSSWTKGKMTKLLLLSGLSSWVIKGVKGGQAFESCLSNTLGSEIGAEIYSSLADFNFSDYQTNLTGSNSLRVCCNPLPCQANPSGCPDKNYQEDFWCQEINETTVCDTYSWVCGGIVNNVQVTNFSYNSFNYSDGAICPNLNETIIAVNDLTNSNAYAYNGFLQVNCSSQINCPPPNYLKSSNSASNSNSSSSRFLNCYWDNGGWSCIYCLDGYNCNSNNNKSQPVNGACYLQWTAPFPQSSNDVPLITGTTVGGTSLIASGGISYYFWRKNRGHHVGEPRFAELRSKLRELEELNSKLTERNSFFKWQIEESRSLITEQQTKIIQSYQQAFSEEQSKAFKDLVDVHKEWFRTKKGGDYEKAEQLLLREMILYEIG